MREKLKRVFGELDKHKVLIALTAVLSVVVVFMNLFTSLRWQGAPGLTFGNVFFTWVPMLICDILIECYGKKKRNSNTGICLSIAGTILWIGSIASCYTPRFFNLENNNDRNRNIQHHIW